MYLSTFLFADTLFAATGGLLVAVVLISKHAMNALDTATVAPNLLLAHAPLNGKPSSSYYLRAPIGLIYRQRCPGRRWLGLSHLHCFYTRTSPDHQPYLAQSALLDGLSMYHCHASDWPGHLVLHAEDSFQFSRDVE